jgi:type VI secretion system secreted protein VgrG
MPVHEITAADAAAKFQLWKMQVDDELGRPFNIELEMLSEKGDVTADKLLGTSLTTTITKPDGGKRHFNGLISRFAYAGRRGRYHVYVVTLRPWLWFLTRTSDCRIFQQMTVPDILEDVFRKKNGFTDFRRSLSGTYRKWEYCVQYRETDFEFVSRLMEQEGIYFFFEHVQGKHTLVMADAPSAHSAMPGGAELPYRGGGDGRVGQDHIQQWLRRHEVQSGAYVLQDYDFTKPNASLEARSRASRSHAHANLEQYDYPGEYTETADGTNYAKARLDELQALHHRAEGFGVSHDLAVGTKFKLVDFPRDAENGEYLCVKAHLDVESGEIENFAADAENKFDARFEAIEAKQHFRTLRTTRKPVIPGPQTAVVVGKEGEEIWTDQYGRVKVQFFWDREGKKDEKSSCWVRVAQVWAGKNWGAMHVPRIGQEVIVEFLEGDPDRPIITGRVYNNDQTVPYTLPENATQSGLKSRSSKEGTKDTFNELRFEDKKGEEQVYFHAEKNFDRVVENNDTTKVGFEKKDKGNQTIEIFNNQKLVVGCKDAEDGSQTIEVWKNRTENVKEGDETVTIEKGNRAITVSKGNDTHTVTEGNREVTVSKGNDTHTVSTGNRVVEVKQGNDTHTISTGNREVTVSKGHDKLTVSVGNLTIDVSAGKCSISAAQAIELTCGASSIKITPSSIALAAPEISIKGDAKVAVSGAMTQVSAQGIAQIQGALVKIN